MEFSSIAFCAKDKVAVDLHTYPFVCGALIRQSSMGIHKSEENPFVELTGHKPFVHSSFEMENLNVAKQFVLTEKVHSFTNNTSNFVRGETIVPQKEIYSHKFPMMALSQLVGGFVGSKSQLGSCGRESFQIWDIIFDKLAELFTVPQSGCCSLYASENPQNCCSLGKDLSKESFGSFCHGNVSILDGSHIVIENSSNPLQDKVSDTVSQYSRLSCNHVPLSLKPLSVMSACTQNVNKLCHAPDVSRQSYADVAKAFAVAEQSKQQCTRKSTMKRRRNSPHCGNLRHNLKHFSWRCCHESSHGNEHVLAVNCRKTPQYSKVASMHKVGKSKTSNTDSKKNVHEVKSDSQTTVSNEVYMDCHPVTVKHTTAENSNCTRSVEDKSAKPSTTIKCSNSVTGVVGDCSMFINKAEEDSMATVIDANGIVQPLPTNFEHHQCSGESSARQRYFSDCSTDSDDSFVSFESGVDSSPVTVALVSDSEPSEDGVSDQFSDDDGFGDDDEDDESEDTETVNRLKEVNARWHGDYSEYSGCEKNPVKVHFACDTSLKIVHPLIAWNYAYRAARCGPWIRMAGDRERFMARIRQMEPLLAMVLSAEHRYSIWSKQMANDK